MVMGSLITFISFVVSMWTCLLVLRVTDPRGDFFDTVGVYWGKGPQILSIVGTLVIIQGAIIAQFMIMT